MIDILLAAGANPNAQLKLFPPYRSLRMDRGADAILDIGTTPLLRAARGADIAAIERLAAAGALLDLPQRDGITPLMVAVGAGASSIDTRGKFRTELDALETADALLAAGAAIDERDERGRTALHYAAAAGYTDVAQAARRARRRPRRPPTPTASRRSTPRTASCAAAGAASARRFRRPPKRCKACSRPQPRASFRDRCPRSRRDFRPSSRARPITRPRLARTAPMAKPSDGTTVENQVPRAR